MMLVLNTVRPNVLRNAKIVAMADKRVITSIMHVLTMIAQSTNVMMPSDPWWIIRNVISPAAFIVIPQVCIVNIICRFDTYVNLFIMSTTNNIFFSVLYAANVVFVACIQFEFLSRYIAWAHKE
jgi:hypothetical protein